MEHLETIYSKLFMPSSTYTYRESMKQVSKDIDTLSSILNAYKVTIPMEDIAHDHKAGTMTFTTFIKPMATKEEEARVRAGLPFSSLRLQQNQKTPLSLLNNDTWRYVTNAYFIWVVNTKEYKEVISIDTSVLDDITHILANNKHDHLYLHTIIKYEDSIAFTLSTLEDGASPILIKTSIRILDKFLQALLLTQEKASLLEKDTADAIEATRLQALEDELSFIDKYL